MLRAPGLLEEEEFPFDLLVSLIIPSVHGHTIQINDFDFVCSRNYTKKKHMTKT